MSRRAAQPLGSSVIICADISKVTDDVIVMGFVALYLFSNNHLSYKVSLFLDLKLAKIETLYASLWHFVMSMRTSSHRVS